ncbi:MAG: hypothetical protein H6738_12630 [Alphaproteobacteria bacterium]|nr:hypothetical protein [Alphaproteobacteria bacterium]
MGQARGTKPFQGQMTADKTALTTVLVGPPMLAYGSDTLRMSGILQQIVDDFGCVLRYRKSAVRPDRPSGPWVDGGTTYSSEDTPFAADFSLAALGSNLWVQPAVAAKRTTSGTAPVEALGAFRAFVQGNSQMVAHQTFEIEPDTNSGSSTILPIGKPFPALGAGGVMVGIVASGFSGTSVTMNLVGRVFTATLDQPSAWDSNLITDKTFTGNDDYNTGDIDISGLFTGTPAFAQLGLVITSTTGRGRLELLAATRY